MSLFTRATGPMLKPPVLPHGGTALLSDGNRTALLRNGIIRGLGVLERFEVCPFNDESATCTVTRVAGTQVQRTVWSNGVHVIDAVIPTDRGGSLCIRLVRSASDFPVTMRVRMTLADEEADLTMLPSGTVAGAVNTPAGARMVMFRTDLGTTWPRGGHIHTSERMTAGKDGFALVAVGDDEIAVPATFEDALARVTKAVVESRRWFYADGLRGLGDNDAVQLRSLTALNGAVRSVTATSDAPRIVVDENCSTSDSVLAALAALRSGRTDVSSGVLRFLSSFDGAHDVLELDAGGTGAVLYMCLKHVEAKGELTDRSNELVEGLAERLRKTWRAADTDSPLLAWAGLKAAIGVAERNGDWSAGLRWGDELKAMEAATYERGFDYNYAASLLAVVLDLPLSATGQREIVDKVLKNLSDADGLLRCNASSTRVSVRATALAVMALVKIGDLKAARQLLARLRAHVNALALTEGFPQTRNIAAMLLAEDDLRLAEERRTTPSVTSMRIRSVVAGASTLAFSGVALGGWGTAGGTGAAAAGLLSLAATAWAASATRARNPRASLSKIARTQAWWWGGVLPVSGFLLNLALQQYRIAETPGDFVAAGGTLVVSVLVMSCAAACWWRAVRSLDALRVRDAEGLNPRR